jgi:hypothetical protein
MVLRRSVPDLDEQGRTAAPLRAARDVQRAALDRTRECTVAFVAQLTFHRGNWSTADATLDSGRLLRGHGE